MTDLSAYIAVASLVRQRRVLVVHPDGPEGPRKLRDAGAARVFVISARVAEEPGISVRAAGTKLPLQSGSVDLVLCLDAIDSFDEKSRRELLSEMSRVLRQEGLVVVRVSAEKSDTAKKPGPSEVPGETPRHPVSFWDLRDELAERLGEVTVLSQVPWSGFSFAAVVEESGAVEGDTQLQLREELLEELPSATNYICVAGSAKLRGELATRCTLVPVQSQLAQVVAKAEPSPAANALPEDFHDELEQLREELAARSARVTLAESRIRELEQSLADGVNKAERDADQLRAEELEQGLAQLRAELELSRRRLGLSEAQREELEQRLANDGDEAQLAEGSLVAPNEAQRDSDDDRRDAELLILEGTVQDHEGQLDRLEGQLVHCRELLAMAEMRGKSVEEELADQRQRFDQQSRVLEDAHAHGVALQDEVHRLTAALAAERARRTPHAEASGGVHGDNPAPGADAGEGPGQAFELAADAGIEQLRAEWSEQITALEADGRRLRRDLELSEDRRRNWELRASIVEGALLIEGDAGDAAEEARNRIVKALHSLTESGEQDPDAENEAKSAGSEASESSSSEELDSPSTSSVVDGLEDSDSAAGEGSDTAAEAADAAQAVASASDTEAEPEEDADYAALDEPATKEVDLRERFGVALLERDRARLRCEQWARAYRAERSDRAQLRAELERLHGMWIAERVHRLLHVPAGERSAASSASRSANSAAAGLASGESEPSSGLKEPTG